MIWLLFAPALASEAGLSVWRQVPIEASPESVLYTQVSEEAVACTVELNLKNTGEVRFLTPLSCPNALFGPVREALLQWRFHPPTEAGRAVASQQKFTAVFEAFTVLLEQKDNVRYAHVRVPPAAVPLWPHAPDKDESLQALFAMEAIRGGSCVLETGVTRRGEPSDLIIVDCPSEVALSIEKALRRWGMKTVGAELGDGTRYRLEMQF
jgi:hypothetical protein